MKNNTVPFTLILFAAMALTSCSAITGIFKAGVVSGIILVVVVVAVIIGIITMLFKKK